MTEADRDNAAYSGAAVWASRAYKARRHQRRLGFDGRSKSVLLTYERAPFDRLLMADKTRACRGRRAIGAVQG